jgi:hypothetical protein
MAAHHYARRRPQAIIMITTKIIMTKIITTIIIMIMIITTKITKSIITKKITTVKMMMIAMMIRPHQTKIMAAAGPQMVVSIFIPQQTCRHRHPQRLRPS